MAQKIGDERPILLINNRSKSTANICFVNSTVQLLRKTGYLQFIESNRNILTSDMTVCHALYSLTTETTSKEKSSETIRKLVAIKSNRPNFNNGSQQDAEEFFRVLINVIIEELKDTSEFNVIHRKHFGKERVSKMFLDNLPLGTCRKCDQFPSLRDEPFLFLKLIVPRSSYTVNLPTLISNH